MRCVVCFLQLLTRESRDAVTVEDYGRAWIVDWLKINSLGAELELSLVLRCEMLKKRDECPVEYVFHSIEK